MWFLEQRLADPGHPERRLFLILLFGKRTAADNGLRASASAPSARRSSSPVGAVYQWIQRVDDYAGSSGGALGALAAFGHSVVPAAAEGHEAAHFVPPVIRQWTWWQVGGMKFTLGTQIDGLPCSVLFVVTIISTLVHLYSIEYVKGDRRYTHFFAALTLFTAGMLCMVIAENTVQFILGWEIMGLCSFLLIGHWWEDYAERRRRAEGVPHREGGRHRPPGRHVGPVLRGQRWAHEHVGSDGFSIFAISGWALSGDASKTILLWGRRRAVHRARSASPASSRCTPGCPTPWPARRRCPR